MLIKSVIFILISVSSSQSVSAAPCSVPAAVYLMTKNPNVAAIDSAQFGTWLDSHL